MSGSRPLRFHAVCSAENEVGCVLLAAEREDEPGRDYGLSIPRQFAPAIRRHDRCEVVLIPGTIEELRRIGRIASYSTFTRTGQPQVAICALGSIEVIPRGEGPAGPARPH